MLLLHILKNAYCHIFALKWIIPCRKHLNQSIFPSPLEDKHVPLAFSYRTVCAEAPVIDIVNFRLSLNQ